MKKIKKIVTVLLALSMIIGTYSVKAFAADSSDEVISLEEYSSEMKELYAEYGVEYEILQKNDDVVLTKGILEKQLKTARQNLEENKQNSENVYIINGEKSDALRSLYGITSNIILRAPMPYNYSHTSNVKIKSPTGMGEACFDLTLNATVDAQYDTFMRINNYTCTQAGGYINYKSWEETSKSHVLSGNNICIVHFYGYLTIEYTEPNTNLLVGYKSYHDISFMFASYWK